MSTPNLALETVPSNSLQPSVPVNASLQILDAVTQLAVEDKDVSAPPVTTGADVGKRWIVAATASGAWIGQEKKIALCTAANEWLFITPAEGWRADVRDENLVYRYSGSAWATLPVTVTLPLIVACSDESTALTTGTAKATFRAPFACTLTGVRASVTTAPTGAVLTVDVNEAGVSLLSTKLTIDAGEKTSTTAATPAVISDSAIADDAELTFDIDTVGSTIAGAGLKVTLFVVPL